MFGRRRREKRQVASIDVFTDDCIGCGRCVSGCRRNVLKMESNGVCQYAIAVNPEACIGCGKCMKACPVGAVELLIA
ncbi:MAG: 4Fe-4S binding protein [Prevotellaceae bacterium]|jgi:ferredoxin|nr:4Fe-4S binding protein [Prevotellaceae bacterium]